MSQEADDNNNSTSEIPRRKRSRKASSALTEEALARAKQAHSVIERRYRDNLNAKIAELHCTLETVSPSPNTMVEKSTYPRHDAFAADQQRTPRIRKSDVMTDAINYVHQSEVSMRHMTDEIQRLTDRVNTLEKLVKCEDCVLLKNWFMARNQRHDVGQIQYER
jgi:vacuolar-type H+-ATPase subunit D/Vma8